MRIHVIRHVDFEDEAHIAVWARRRGHTVTHSLLHRGESLPDPDSSDVVVVMGGPMNIDEETRHPFLKSEKEFLRSVIDAGKKTLGICLGAQLLSGVMGGRVTRNPEKEIGWFDVSFAFPPDQPALFRGLAVRLTAFHWHGDTFSVPPGCARIASSAGCANQGFVKNDQVIALQFHAECTPESVQLLAQSCGDEIIPGRFIVPVAEMTDRPERFETANRWMDKLLDNWLA